MTSSTAPACRTTSVIAPVSVLGATTPGPGTAADGPSAARWWASAAPAVALVAAALLARYLVRRSRSRAGT